ncbi:MAG: primosomal protein N' [Actinomycetota bacterium]|nr:primosomal protein N' [Actinomycetota bacterium]
MDTCNKYVKKYAEVYLNIKALKIDHPFDYRIPSDLLPYISTGVVVEVPFKNRIEIGYVVKTSDKSELPDKEIKDIIKVIDSKPVFDSGKIELINWMSNYYIQPLGSVISLLLPPGGKYRKSSSHSDIKLKFKDYVYLNREKYLNLKDTINLNKNRAQKRIIDYLITHGEVSKEKLIRDTHTSYSSINSLLKKDIISIIKKREKRDFKYEYNEGREPEQKIVLNQYQKTAVSGIEDIIDKKIFHRFLIEGVTGSGKTDIYIAVCKKVLQENKRAFVLTPEISLIPQLFSRFESEFGSRVCVYHSNMSAAERYERWLDIRDNKFDIVIGTRSSIFTPLDNPGIIILDEEHDTSYKEGTMVRYNTGDVSTKMGEILGIPVIFGSATPDIVTRYRAEKENNFTLFRIPIRARSNSSVEMNVIDLKSIDHRKEDITITNKLHRAIKDELDKNNKVIIFINRRGYSNFVICNKCGNVPKCPACELPFNYHNDIKKLMCHHCGREQDYTGKCPSCGEDSIILRGTGIQKVQTKLEARFKNVTVLRMDSDITAKKKSHQEILQKFISPGAAILIGTQMIAKGLDIEDVTLVGIINCDSMFGLPDYHMNERIYQLITQVSGRTGRKDKKGRVIIQTFNPESTVIKNVLKNDYESFYREEIKNRMELNYPPFSNLINIIISGKNEAEVKIDIGNLFKQLSEVIAELEDSNSILGPAPAPFYKINLFYRWHIMVKTKDIYKFNSIFAEMLKVFKKFNENKIIVDVDPVWIL